MRLSSLILLVGAAGLGWMGYQLYQHYQNKLLKGAGWNTQRMDIQWSDGSHSLTRMSTTDTFENKTASTPQRITGKGIDISWSDGKSASGTFSIYSPIKTKKGRSAGKQNGNKSNPCLEEDIMSVSCLPYFMGGKSNN